MDFLQNVISGSVIGTTEDGDFILQLELSPITSYFAENLNLFQVEVCLNHMFDALLDLEKEGLTFGGCGLNAIE